MLLYFKFLLSVLCIVSAVSPCRSQSAYVCPLVRAELKEAFRDAWKLDDIASLHYAISSYAVLNEKIPIAAQDVCTYIKKILSQTESLEAIYHVTAIAKDVPACASSQLLSDAGKKILSATEKPNVNMEDLYYIALSLSSVTSNLTDTSTINKLLKDALKSNETLLNLGYAFHIGSLLPKSDAGTLLDKKIDHVISQVDEVDSKYYQFEGGLTLTALIVEGIYKLSETLGKAPSLTNTQLVKFFDYFLSRLSVSRPRGVFALLKVLNKLNDNKFHVFVIVNTIEDHLISKANPKIQVYVSDVFGEPVFKDATSLTVTFKSGKANSGNQPISTPKALSPSTDKKTYTTTITELNLTPDTYVFTVSVAAKTDAKIIVNGEQRTVKFKVTYKAKINNLQIGVLDSEQSSTSDLKKLDYPNRIKEELNIDSQQRLMLKFSVVDLDFTKTYKIQQAFVKLIDKQTKNEATFVCSSDSNRNYKISIDPWTAKTALKFVSGDYDLVLIVGDVLISESIQWTLASVKFRHISEQLPTKSDYIEYYYKPKPEIQHLFRTPERRPSPFVSNVFTALVLTPLIILFALWLKLGINIKNFPFSLSAVSFHAGLGGIFVLFGVFWLQLNMFQTIKYLLLLGFVTFLSGNKMLCSIASKRKK